MPLKWILTAASAALALAGIAWVYDNYSGYARDHYERRRYPAIQGRSELGQSVARDIARRKYRDLIRDVRRVEGKLKKAARNGHDVRYLKKKMPRVIRLARAGNYKYARIHLNTIEVRIPGFRQKEKLRVLQQSDFKGEKAPRIKGRPAQRRRRRKR